MHNIGIPLNYTKVYCTKQTNHLHLPDYQSLASLLKVVKGGGSYIEVLLPRSWEGGWRRSGWRRRRRVDGKGEVWMDEKKCGWTLMNFYQVLESVREKSEKHKKNTFTK